MRFSVFNFFFSRLLANREDFKKQKILDEARKAGKAPALLDEEGHVINPHIPEYIVKAPCKLFIIFYMFL